MHVHFMATMLVYFNVQYSMGTNYFLYCYGEMQAANRPSFVYYNTDNCNFANNGRITTASALLHSNGKSFSPVEYCTL